MPCAYVTSSMLRLLFSNVILSFLKISLACLFVAESADIAGGRIRRVVEWKTRRGILRFGVPKRFDGQVRMEAQFAVALNLSGYINEREDSRLDRCRF